MNITTSWYSILAKADTQEQAEPASISIHDEIGLWGITAKDFIHDMNKLGADQPIALTLHTPGGDVSEGVKIYNALRQHKGKVTVTVDALAASMGSIIALAGDEVKMVDNGFIMVHNPWTMAAGDADTLSSIATDLKKFEDILATIYEQRTEIPRDEIRAIMAEETWLTAEESKEKGFISEIISSDLQAVASLKNFQGAFARKLEANRPLPTLGTAPLITKTKEETMDPIENTDEMQAQIDQMTADLAQKTAELEAATMALTAKTEEAESELTAALASAAELIGLGRAHNQLDLAVDAIALSKSVDEFKSDLLAAYGKNVQDATVTPEDDFKADASIEPETREIFLRTYSSIEDGRDRSTYWGNHSAKFGL